MTEAGHDHGVGRKGSRGELGKVIPYDEFLRARAKRSPDPESAAPPTVSPERDGTSIEAPGSESPAPEHTGARPSTSVEEADASQIHMQRIEDVRARIRDGFYDRPAVLEETVERILTSLGDGKSVKSPAESEW